MSMGNSKPTYNPASMSSMSSMGSSATSNTTASAATSTITSFKDSVVSSVSNVAGKIGTTVGLKKEAPKGMLGATEVQPTMMGGMTNYAPPLSMQGMGNTTNPLPSATPSAAYSPYGGANTQSSAAPTYNPAA